MRRLTTPSHVMSLTPGAERIQETLSSGRADQSQTYHRSYDALISHFLQNDEHLWTDIPVPSVADPNETNLLGPKTLLECCQCAQEFSDEYDLPSKCLLHVDAIFLLLSEQTKDSSWWSHPLSGISRELLILIPPNNRSYV